MLNEPGESALDEVSLVERILLWLAVIGIVGLCAIVTITVFSRWLGRPLIPDDVLIVRELMVAVIIFPLAAVTALRAHLSVTVFTDRMGSGARRWLDLLGNVIGVLFVTVLGIAGWRLFIGAWRSGEYFDGILYLPMWPGYLLFVSGLAVFGIRLLLNTLTCLRIERVNPTDPEQDG